MNVFPVGTRFVFKYYFEDRGVCARLNQYYNTQHYRFEVPPADFAAVRNDLEARGYGLVIVEAVEEFIVVVRKYNYHPSDIF